MKLQKELGREMNGIYDADMAAWLYAEKRYVIPKEEGYLAHEVNPDLLFDRRYRSRVYGIDRLLWRLLGLKPDELKEDDIEIGVTKTETVMGEVGELAGNVSNNLAIIEEILSMPEIKDLFPNAKVYETMLKTHKTYTKLLGQAEVVIAVGAVLEEDFRDGVVDVTTWLDAIAEGGKTIVVQKGSEAVTAKLLALIPQKDGFWGGFARFIEIAIVLYGVVEGMSMTANAIDEYLRTDFWFDISHFDEWQQSFHERDLKEGRPMD